MKKILFIVCFLLTVLAYSQKIPMNATYWEYDSSKTKFTNHRGVSVTKPINGVSYQIFLKDHIFTNGTIEFDVELTGVDFPSINFRMSEDRKNGELFYIRAIGEVNPFVRTTLQYAAIINDVNMWNLTDEYQAGASIKQKGWNHVKLVINGQQMRVYVNDMEKPALLVPKLESWQESGKIALSGDVIYANFEIKPNETEGLSPEAGYTSKYNDTRYLKNWEVSEAIDFPFGQDLKMPLPRILESDLPDSSTVWKAIKAESRAMVNLSSNFGLPQKKNARRLAWLKTTVHSESAQEKSISLGFSDEVWVFLNGKLLYVDKNFYGTPSQKPPIGRTTIENASFKLSLKKGDNEILVGLANYFYGWGLVVRLDNMGGITLK